ncbi:MAG TPA: hypothetical protein HPP87_02095 [Planctomycetes bacterium]|nr:hypothetical protein [Planctomycetota bacterium]HIJ70138.1 hypothetical protein [Planctomycetota bacterium]
MRHLLMNNENPSLESPHVRFGFSLVEIVAVLLITAMIMLASFNVYGRVRSAAAKVNETLDRDTLATEILQRIAEDLDRLAFSDLGTTIFIQNKLDSSGYNVAQIAIKNEVYDENNKPKVFEKIVWRSAYDFFEDSLILYRSHNGYNLEDKVISDDRQIELKQDGNDYFIPLCSGITLFKIQVPVVKVFGENVNLPGLDEVVQESGEKERLLDGWAGNKLPKAVTITISFAEPYQADTGGLDVLESEKFTRTIAIDRTRQIKYRFVARDLEPIDPNDLLGEDFDDTDTDDF